MANAARLVRSMQQIATPKESSIVDIMTATVTSVDPLIVKTDKLTLSATFLTVGALCKRKVIPARVVTGTTTVNGSNSGGSMTSTGTTTTTIPEVVLWEGLAVGDSVYMLRCSEGQKYFILQKVEGV